MEQSLGSLEGPFTECKLLSTEDVGGINEVELVVVPAGTPNRTWFFKQKDSRLV